VKAMELGDMNALNQWLAERSLGGHWDAHHPLPTPKPHLWKWADIWEGLQAAGELVPMDATARRTIQLKNPALDRGMTNTIHISIQLVKPGEIAKAHRHTAAAIRYVLKGSPKGFTIVEGERFAMEEGDLITTPNWTWHDHYNGSSEPIVWLDGLDVRLVSSMGAMLQENYQTDQQPIEKPDGYSANTLGRARPAWIKSPHLTPPFRYRWKETHAALQALKESAGDPCDGILLEYTNPFSGGPTLPTFSCEIQLLRSKEKTRSHRHTSTTIYHAFRGEGSTVVGGQQLKWTQGDIFLVPPWFWHSHENRQSEDAILFSTTDRPAAVALGLYREEIGAA
jgi:1-hydroxy-2-naphthoate dioxygenase